jgi:hypothetical protein
MIGVEMSISADIALALGSTESIVESLYSVMKSQSMEGGQSKNTLALRYITLAVLVVFLALRCTALGARRIIHYSCNRCLKSNRVFLSNCELVSFPNFRTKIDWLMPTVIKAVKLVTGIAQLYHDGNKSHNLPKHRWPILSHRATYGPGKDLSKVMAKKTAEGVRLPFLL